MHSASVICDGVSAAKLLLYMLKMLFHYTRIYNEMNIKIIKFIIFTRFTK